MATGDAGLESGSIYMYQCHGEMLRVLGSQTHEMNSFLLNCALLP